MREELCIDVDMGEQHHPDMLLVHFKELEKLRHHVSPVQWHRQQTHLPDPYS